MFIPYVPVIGFVWWLAKKQLLSPLCGFGCASMWPLWYWDEHKDQGYALDPFTCGLFGSYWMNLPKKSCWTSIAILPSRKSHCVHLNTSFSKGIYVFRLICLQLFQQFSTSWSRTDGLDSTYPFEVSKLKDKVCFYCSQRLKASEWTNIHDISLFIILTIRFVNSIRTKDHIRKSLVAILWCHYLI